MTADKTLVLTRLWILFRTEKQHVLQKVGQALVFTRVMATTDTDVQCCGSFFGGGVGDQENLELVIQNQMPIGSRIVGTGFDITGLEYRATRQNQGCQPHCQPLQLAESKRCSQSRISRFVSIE